MGFLKIPFTRYIMRTPFKIFFLGILFASVLWIATVYYFFYYDSISLISRELSINQFNHSTTVGVSDPVKTLHNVVTQSKIKNASKKFGENDLGLVRSKEDQKLREDGYTHHSFNVLVSSRLDYHRSIPDTRHKL